MFRTRIILFVALFVSAAVSGVFGQARDFEPPTPEEDLTNIAGAKPDAGDPEHQQFFPRQMQNPAEEGKDRSMPTWGRSPFVVRDENGDPVQIAPPSYVRGDAHTVVMDLDQYMLDFEFETPRWISVTAPDGSPQIYWYMIYRAINWDTFPLRSHLSFEIRTMAQDLAPEPQMTAEQLEEQKRDLLRQFVGDDSEDGSQKHYEQYVDELFRGIERSLTNNYLNYPDRALMDAICNKERRWEEDQYGRLYNSLVPAHHFQWRKRLMVEDKYRFPELLLQSYSVENGRVKADAYIVSPQYVPGAAEPNVTVTLAPWNGAPSVLASNVPLSSFLNGQGKNITLDMLSEATFVADADQEKATKIPTFKVSLGEAIQRYMPRYQKGDRVDAYGFRLREGHPDYERGVLINSDFTIATQLHGATLTTVDTADGPYKGMQEVNGMVTVPHGEAADMYRLPEMNGTKLISPPVESMIRIVTTLNTLFELKDKKAEPLRGQFQDLVRTIHEASLKDRQSAAELDQYRRNIIQVVALLLPMFDADAGRDENSRTLPDVVFYDIESLVVRQSRLTFAEAHGQNASLMGRSQGGYLWDAMYHPASCYVKLPVPRRYQPGDNVLRNYHLPSETVWGIPGDPDYGRNVNRAIGEDKSRDTKTFVTGAILDAYEYGNKGLDETVLPAPAWNRYGKEGGRDYDGAAVEVSNGSEPWYDTVWNRGNGEGRPVKRLDHLGNSLADGIRHYRPGDRVTPMEWEAYGAITPVGVLREYGASGGYEPGRKFLRYGDLLVGQPRLILARFRYNEISVLGERTLEPKAQFINGHVPGHKEVMVDGDGTLWRHGFQCDAAGDYDAVIYEDLPAGSRAKFDEWEKNSVEEWAARQAMARGEGTYAFDKFVGLDYLRPVPVMGREGAAEDYINPITNEGIPMRSLVLPAPDQPVTYARDSGGNVIWARKYEMLPRYIYEYDYLRISEDEADANKQEEGVAGVDVRRFSDEARAAGAARRTPPSVVTYWDREQATAKNTDELAGLFKVDDRPTLRAAEIIV
ncbi:MAG: hypothetical protein AB7K09_23640, partial [Planctomycetota bacterium]